MRKKPFWKYLIFFVVLLVLFLALVAGFGFVKFSQIHHDGQIRSVRAAADRRYH